MPAKKRTSRPPRRKILAPKDRKAIRESLLAGEKQSALAAKYGVTSSAISLINVELRAEFGDATAITLMERKRKVTPGDWKRFVTAIRKTTPEKEGIEGGETESGAPWDVESATRFGEKFLGRVPPPARLVKALNLAFPIRKSARKPTPPERFTIDSISPDLRDNKKFVAYITSETYWQIQHKEYDDALKQYEILKESGLADEPPTPSGNDDEEDVYDGTGPLPDIPEHLLKQ